MRWNNPEVRLDTDLRRVVVRFAWLPTKVQSGTVWLERYRQHQWTSRSGNWWNGIWRDCDCYEGAVAREVYP